MADSAVDQRVLEVLIRYGIDRASLQAVKDGTMTVEDALTKMGDAAQENGERTTSALENISNSISKLSSVGRLFSNLGRAESIFGRLLGDEDLKRLGQATRGVGMLILAVGRLGQVMRLIGNLPDWGKALGAGALGAAAGVGIYDKFIGPQQQTYNYVTGQMQANSAENILKQTITVAEASFAGLTQGIDKGREVFYDAAQKYGLVPPEVHKVSDALTALKDTSKLSAEEIWNAVQTIAQSAEAMKKAAAEAPNNITSLFLKGAGGIFSGIADLRAAQSPQTKAFDEYQKQLTDANNKAAEEQLKVEEETQVKINDVIKKGVAERIKDYAKFEEEATKAAETLNKQITAIRLKSVEQDVQQETAFNESQIKNAQAHGIEMVRIEEDFARQRKFALQEYTLSARKLANERDALGLEDLAAQFKMRQSQDQENHNVEVARKNEDFARQQAEAQVAFNAQQELRHKQEQQQIDDLKRNEAEQADQRKKDYDAMVAEKANQRQEEIDALKADGKTKSDTTTKNLADEISKINDAWTIRRRDLGIWLVGEQQQFDDYMAARQKDLQKWIDTHLNIPGTTVGGSTVGTDYGGGVSSHAAGGYSKGLTMTGEEGTEFILNRQTTLMAEAMAGRKLDQQSIMALMAQKPANINLTMNQTLTGSQTEPEEYRRIVHEELRSVMVQAKIQAGWR